MLNTSHCFRGTINDLEAMLLMLMLMLTALLSTSHCFWEAMISQITWSANWQQPVLVAQTSALAILAAFCIYFGKKNIFIPNQLWSQVSCGSNQRSLTGNSRFNDHEMQQNVISFKAIRKDNIMWILFKVETEIVTIHSWAISALTNGQGRQFRAKL